MAFFRKNGYFDSSHDRWHQTIATVQISAKTDDFSQRYCENKENKGNIS